MNKNNFNTKKLRAFQDGEMIYQEYIGVQGSLTFLKKLYYDNYDVMEPTGLKDKKGAMIYEGDILESKSDYKFKLNPIEKVYSPHFTHEVVAFIDGCFTISVIKQENSYYGDLPSKPKTVTHLVSKYYEVIGNIYDK